MTVVFPSTGYTFGGAECGEGKCADCHSIGIKETQEKLKDLVGEVHGVDFSEIPGFYVVDATGKNGKRGLIYMDFSRKYILLGTAIGISDRRNITKREIRKLRRVDLSTIPLADSLVVGDSKASTRLILFTDPQCPFCKKLHPELKKVVNANPDVVFHIKMLPLINLHPDAYRISKTILCSGSVELLEDSFADKKIPDPSCETDAVDRTLKLAKSLGIISTPTLILPDGSIHPGYKSAEDILKLLKNP